MSDRMGKITMDARSKAFWTLKVGDIFHGDSLICLATSITDTAIHARRVTTQDELRFNRMTGRIEMDEDRIAGEIDSICRLPADIDATMLGIDENSGSKPILRS